MIQTNIKNLFEAAGLENIRPTDEALEEMGISRRRFTQLLENVNKSSITYDEVNSLRNWISGIKELDPEAIIEGQSQTAEIAEDLGLSK